jgi:hypothetical protein
MRISKRLVILALLMCGISCIHAQQKASPEQLQKALEIFRQQSHSPAQSAPAPAPVSPSPKTQPASPAPLAKPAAKPAPPSAPAQSAPASLTAEEEKKARALIKATEAPAIKPPAVPAPAPVQPTPPSTPPVQDTVKSSVPAAPSVAPPPWQTAAPAGLTPEQQMKAFDVLRSIESSRQASGTSPKGVSEQEREAAIKRALDEAKRLAEQNKLQREQDTKAAEERDLVNEISKVEEELLKAKQQFPSTNAILGSTVGGTVPVQPLAVKPLPLTPPPPPPVAPAIPAPGSTPPSAPARPVMSQQQESHARALIEEAAPAKPATAPPAAAVHQEASEGAREASKSESVSGKAQAASAPAASSAVTGAASSGKAASPRTAPEAAGSKRKQERLSELLEAYRQDKITPQEYHLQRARILHEK